MKTKMFALLLVITMVMAWLPAASAQDAMRDWPAVQAIATGTELFVETKDGKTIRGTLNYVRGTTVSLSSKVNDVVLEQNAIRRVYLAKTRSRTATALIGAGIGGAVGVGSGIAVANSDDTSIGANFAPLSFGFVGVVGGAVVGALLGGRQRKGRLLYEAQ